MRSVPRRLRVPGASPAMAAFWTSRVCAPWRRCIFQTKAWETLSRGHRQLGIHRLDIKRDGMSDAGGRGRHAAMATPVTSAHVAKARVRPDRRLAASSWSGWRGKGWRTGDGRRKSHLEASSSRPSIRPTRLLPSPLSANLTVPLQGMVVHDRELLQHESPVVIEGIEALRKGSADGWNARNRHRPHHHGGYQTV
jgi:hypothetical protein